MYDFQSGPLLCSEHTPCVPSDCFPSLRPQRGFLLHILPTAALLDLHKLAFGVGQSYRQNYVVKATGDSWARAAGRKETCQSQRHEAFQGFSWVLLQARPTTSDKGTQKCPPLSQSHYLHPSLSLERPKRAFVFLLIMDQAYFINKHLIHFCRGG